MTSTSQKTEVEAKSGVSPEQAAAKDDTKTVPLGEHIELRQKNREMTDRLAQLEAQLASSKSQPAVAAPADNGLADRLQRLERQNRLGDIAAQLGTDAKQSEAVAALLDKSPDLTPEEALTLASRRNKDLFKGEDDGFQPGIHASARPGVRLPEPTKPEVDSMAERAAQIRDLSRADSKKRDIGKADRLLNNWLGTMAAADVGKPGHSLYES
jgi:hypothetical protein